MFFLTWFLPCCRRELSSYGLRLGLSLIKSIALCSFAERYRKIPIHHVTVVKSSPSSLSLFLAFFLTSIPIIIPVSTMVVEHASLGDGGQIKTLIDFYAAKDKMIPRSLSEIYEYIRDFLVFRDKKLVVGCCALHVSWSDLAEIRSLAVDPRYANRGIGTALVSACITEAKQLGVKRVFTLTNEPEFFEKRGFVRVPKSELPMKIWGECIHCNKYPECDEEALVFKIK